jgi:hypothetical protein
MRPEIRVEVLILNNDPWYEQLLRQRSDIEQELGHHLTWKKEEGVQNTRIILRTPLDPTDRSNWPECHAWTADRLVRMDAVFRKRVAGLG